MVLVLGIVKASLEILGIGIGVKKVVLLMSDVLGRHFRFIMLCKSQFKIIKALNQNWGMV